MNKKIALLPGDGIGTEIVAEAVKVLDKVGQKFGHKFEYKTGLIGGSAYASYGNHFPAETVEICKNADAMLLGAVGGPVDKQDDPKWKNVERNSILGFRKQFNLSINLRPVVVNTHLTNLSPLKKSIIEKGVDFVIVRELVGGIYFGEHKRDGDNAVDVMEYSKEQIKIAVEYGFKAAVKRNNKLTLVDKANVLETSRLWREVAENLHSTYSEVQLEYMYIDNATMQVVKNPSDFDVVVTSNMFGDILSDTASVLPGSLGMMPSASLGNKYSLYEPIHGSAPDIAGLGIANPIATILSVAMMLRYSFDLEEEAQAIEKTVELTIAEGVLTGDIVGESGVQPVGTERMGDEIVRRI